MDDFETKSIADPVVSNPNSQRIFPIEETVTPSGFALFYRNNKWYIWAIVAALAIIGVLGFLAFRQTPASPTKEANVNLSVDMPGTLPTNGDFIFRVKIENRDPAKLVGMNLDVIYPDGVEYVSSSPSAKSDSGSSFEVPDLVSGQNAVVTIKAHMQGGINDVKEVSATLRYRYDNFNSNFEKKASAQARLSASDILLEIDGPLQISSSQAVVYEVKYTNNSGNDLQNARVQLDYPDNFSFSQSDPSPALAKNIWNISSLATGESGTIKVTGNFSSAGSGESKTMSAQFLVLDSSGNFFAQAKTDFTTQISGQPLVVSQALEQSNGGIVAPGADLSYRVRYQNNGQNPALGVNIVVTLDSKALDLNSIEADDAQVSGNTITWNAANVGSLENLGPSATGELRYTVKVKNPAVKDTSKNLTIKSSIKIKSEEYETFLPGNTVETKISSVASISSSLAYVSGSLPPKVGQDTVYKITLSLRNSTNDLSGTQVIAYIPLSPSSYDSASVTAKEAPQVSFDKSTGKLTWNAGTVPAHTGDFNPARVLQFNIRLRPTSVQAGDSVTLLRGIAASFKDSFTSQTTKLTQQDLTTRDVPDDNGNNYGTVIK